MGLKWRFVPQSETRETYFGASKYFNWVNPHRLRQFETGRISRHGAALDSELHLS